MAKELFNITGMTCAGCSARVEKTVAGLEGVQQAAVNLLTNSMEVRFDEGVLTAQDIIKAVEKTGYGASVKGKESASPKAGKTAAEAEVKNAKIRKQTSVEVPFEINSEKYPSSASFWLLPFIYSIRYLITHPPITE